MKKRGKVDSGKGKGVAISGLVCKEKYHLDTAGSFNFAKRAVIPLKQE